MCDIEGQLHRLRAVSFGVKFFDGGVRAVVELPGHDFVEVEHRGSIDDAIVQLSYKLGNRKRAAKYRETNNANEIIRKELRRKSKPVSRKE